MGLSERGLWDSISPELDKCEIKCKISRLALILATSKRLASFWRRSGQLASEQPRCYTQRQLTSAEFGDRRFIWSEAFAVNFSQGTR